MFRLAAAALGLSVLAACSGHSALSSIPPVSNQGSATQTAAQTQTVTRRAATLPAAPAGWATTATQALTLANASDLGPLSPSQPLTIRLGLALRNMSQLTQSLQGGGEIDPGTFTATYGPTSDTVAQATAYLQSQGFTNIQVEPNNVLISADGTAAIAQKAFNTTLHGFSQNGLNVYANTAPAFVPQALGSSVVAVLGLNNAQVARTNPRKQAAPPNPTPCTANVEGLCPRNYDPGSFQLAYDAVGTPTGSNTAIAIMTEGQLATSIADFRTNEQKFNLPQVPVTIVHVGAQGADTSGNDEWTLDMTYSSGMAGQLRQLYLYNFPSLSDSDIVLGYSRWATDKKAKIANSSFGGCEAFPYLDGAMLVADEILVEAAAQGQTMFVSTGDTGAYCGVAGVPPNGAPGGLPFAEWPAVSPYVVAVGGTDLFSNPDGSYLGESAWEAGGGGLSQFEYSPYWESPTQPVGTTPAGLSFRGLPDVAMDAALETGALLYTSTPAVNGSCTPCITGGTSLASPLAAGVWARLQSAHGNALGFAPIKLYRIYASNPSPSETSGGPPPTQLVGGFHDILSGSNGGYTALPRFDYTTGMGSFDVGKTVAAIQ
ncbi:MAG: S8/S53 family peptidase [Candidatus Eremiobacteraeota bacterium]|nr:S8/S53 family peptidase [Candidatus Eremiobacteraeota bacterium]